MSRNNHRHRILNQHENRRQPSRSSSLSDVQPRKATVYMIDQVESSIDKPSHEKLISRATNGIEASVVFPTLTPRPHVRRDSRPYMNIPSDYRDGREPVHLPLITRQRRQNYPHEYFNPPVNYYPPERFHYPHVVQLRCRSPRNYKHEEMYDPGRWYMRKNSIYSPKLRWPANPYCYSPPKWYESPYRR